MKLCSRCKELKELSEFRNDKHRKSGKTSRCKKCLAKYIQQDAVCIYCTKWFTKKQSNYKFCSLKCHNAHWSKVYRLGVRGTIYHMEYNRKYKRKSHVI